MPGFTNSVHAEFYTELSSVDQMAQKWKNLADFWGNIAPKFSANYCAAHANLSLKFVNDLAWLQSSSAWPVQ